MHEEMQQLQPVSSTYGTTTPTNVDKDKEEQLWTQQRLVTALKRKVQTRRRADAFDRMLRFITRSNRKHAVCNRTVCRRFSNIRARQLPVLRSHKRVRVPCARRMTEDNERDLSFQLPLNHKK